MSRTLRLLLAALLVAVIVVGIVAVVRASMVRSRQVAVAPVAKVSVDNAAALGRFAEAVQFRTISYDDARTTGDHERFIAWLPGAYPRVRAAMQREIVGGRSLLYRWQGSDAKLPPILVMGHYDVVPVEPAAERKWTHPPFSGTVQDGFIWGRGTMDDKASTIASLEAAEMLLAAGWQPKRTIYFAFGHDEERGGADGATVVAKTLAARGVKFDSILDEGGAITIGLMPGVSAPVAVIGVAEKGFLSVELSASDAGGHSSMPPPLTAVGRVARAVDVLQSHQLPASVGTVTRWTVDWITSEMAFGPRLIAANLWLTSPLIVRQAHKSESLNAVLRTTTAPTTIGGGVKDNIIPTEARAVVNFRILPGETVESVVAHVREAVDDDRVKIRFVGAPQQPSPVSPAGSPQFALLSRTIRQVFPDAVVAPYLVVGATDARHYVNARLSPNVYRFAPMRATARDLQRAHGIDERLSVEDFLGAIRFYRQWMLNAAS